MTRPENQGPWGAPGNRRAPKKPSGLFVWLGLLIAASVALWLLAEAFPGSLSDGSDQIYLVRALLILALISSGMVFSRKIDFGRMGRDIAAWLALGFVVVLGYSYQAELKAVGARMMAELAPSRPVALSQDALSLTRGEDGHFQVIGWADNTRIRFLIDTGATNISLSPADAKRIGVDFSALRYTTRYQTANGVAYGAPYRLKILSIGPIEFRDVAVSISQTERDESLLGMSFLNRLSSFEITGRKLIMRR